MKIEAGWAGHKALFHSWPVARGKYPTFDRLYEEVGLFAAYLYYSREAWKRGRR